MPKSEAFKNAWMAKTHYEIAQQNRTVKSHYEIALRKRTSKTHYENALSIKASP
jgi:hypothetical protein